MSLSSIMICKALLASLCGAILISQTSAGSTSGNKSDRNNTMASLDNFIRDQVVPDVVDGKPAAGIQIGYPSGARVNYGNELTPTQVKDEPKVSFDAKADQLYTLAMVDPDAPSRKEPKFREILHFLVANIPGKDVAKGDILAEYVGSGPPQGTGMHRYVFLVYRQDNGKLNSEMKISKTSRVGRASFSIRKFAKDNKLGSPIAGNFYQAQFDSYVPQLHAQLNRG